MAFFDSLGKKASEATAKAVQKAQELSETTKLNGMIAEEGRKISDTYQQIGKLYAEVHSEDFEEQFADMIALVKSSEQKISDYRSQIQHIKGVSICGKCGAEVSQDAVFCSSCGAPIPHEAAAVSEDCVICGNCGAQVKSWMRFCTACGHSMPQDAEESPEINLGADEVEGESSDESLIGGNSDSEKQAVTEIPEENTCKETVPQTADGRKDEETAGEKPQEVPSEGSTSRPEAVRTCPHCGAVVEKDQLFCIECGNSL